MRLDSRAGRRGLVALAAVGTVAAIGYFDRLTGTEISFSIFYLLPAAYAFWRGGLWPGIVAAASGAAAWLIADLSAGHRYTHPVIPYWNSLMRGLIFLTVGLLLLRLKRMLERERLLATRDALTGIGNWRHFEAVANREIGRSQRSGKPLSAAYVDLDDFKKVNDSLGHRAGDALLLLVASVLQKSIRTFDCVARLGGDEFVVLMPDTELEGGRAVVERIRRLVEGALREGSWAVSLSVGLVTFLRVPDSIDEIIKTADGLMYRAKKSGKASVTELVVQG